MFDHIGRDLDDEASKRGAASFTLTLMGLAGVVGFVVTVTAYTAAEVLLEPEVDGPMVLLEQDPRLDDPLPALPPPPPPPAGAASPETPDDTPEVPDDPVEPKPLEEHVPEPIVSAATAGTPGGQPGGDPNGVPGGIPGGVPGGDPDGRPGGDVRVFHHSELEVRRRVSPDYPAAARELNLGDQRCIAVVTMDPDGVPYRVEVSGCPKVFEAPTREAMLGWRWYPPRDGRGKVEARTTIAVTFRTR